MEIILGDLSVRNEYSSPKNGYIQQHALNDGLTNKCINLMFMFIIVYGVLGTYIGPWEVHFQN